MMRDVGDAYVSYYVEIGFLIFRSAMLNMLAHRVLYYSIIGENKTTCFISTGLFRERLHSSGDIP